jgi:hypothetical protein
MKLLSFVMMNWRIARYGLLWETELSLSKYILFRNYEYIISINNGKMLPYNLYTFDFWISNLRGMYGIQYDKSPARFH